MSAESDFEDTVKICEFYADPCDVFELDEYFQFTLKWEEYA